MATSESSSTTSPVPSTTSTPTSSSTVSSSSSSSSSSSTVSSTTSSSSASSSAPVSSSVTPTSSDPSTTAPPSTTSNTSLTTSLTTRTTTASGGGAITVINSVTITPTVPTSTATTTGTAVPAKGFFQNTGAVAGVFSVVGLIILAIIIMVITTIIRRRRAKQFDREIEAAAAEAATAPVPVFLDDDDDNYRYGGYGGAPNNGYSDASSHGTYSQQPLSHDGNDYPMSERSGGDAYSAGAAGVGVQRARSSRQPGGYAAGLAEGETPYPAFIAPGPGGYMPQYDSYSGYSQQPYQDLNRNLSQSTRSQYSQHTQQDQYGNQYQAMAVPVPNGGMPNPHEPASATTAMPNPHDGLTRRASQKSVGLAYDDGDAYGGYSDQPAQGQPQDQGIPNPFSARRESSDDDDDDEAPNRVLKVAN